MNRYWIARMLLLGALGAVAISLPTGTTAQEAREAEPTTIPTAPLPKTDPRARMTVRAMINAQPIPTPKEAKQARLPDAQAAKVMAFDIKTGRQSTEAFTPPRAADPVLTNDPQTGSYKASATEPRLPSKTVFGTDDRIRITPTTSYPWRTHCKLWMKFPNGNWYIASGTLIGRKHVITAGHCVYQRELGGWATQIYVAPGYDMGYKPYGGYYATRLRTWSGWATYGNYDWDMGLITLSQPIGDTTGWLGYGWWSNLTQVLAHLVGYPGMLDGGESMRYSYGLVNTQSEHQLYYTIDSSGGNSGGGIYRIVSGNRYVIGAHSWGGSTSNGACRICPTKFEWLRSSIASGT